ncbi:MAG: transporter substrate-binding domain-containing protein, partial [Ilumatobacteraceae bacterium]
MRRRLTLGSIALSVVMLTTACGSDSNEAQGSDSTAATESSAAGDVGDAATDPATCAEGKTLTAGTLTIATGDPAFPPYVLDDDPASGQGFEAAVAMRVAELMGFTGDAVTWVRTGFDEAVQPGPKRFDFNLQQYSITDERKQVVSFSDPYYTAAPAILGYEDSPAATVDNVEGFAALKLGAAAGTTSLDYITDVIKPDSAPFVFNDNAAAKQALDSKQIDAIVTDLPTALYITAVEM